MDGNTGSERLREEGGDGEAPNQGTGLAGGKAQTHGVAVGNRKLIGCRQLLANPNRFPPVCGYFDHCFEGVYLPLCR